MSRFFAAITAPVSVEPRAQFQTGEIFFGQLDDRPRHTEIVQVVPAAQSVPIVSVIPIVRLGRVQ